MQSLRLRPEFLWPLVVWFSVDATKLRPGIKDADAIILGELIKPRTETKTSQVSDAIDWFQEIVKGKKTSLHNLKLMDSVLKESQRLEPTRSGVLVSMHRRAMEDVELSDGTKIARRNATAGSAERMWDPSFYQNPNEFDGYRFYQAGGSSGDAANQLVTTSTSHMGFGHSMHSCPGRFFASNEAKVVLCHLLLKYDFKMAAGEKPKVARFGSTFESDSEVKVSIRRSQEEIDLSAQGTES